MDYTKIKISYSFAPKNFYRVIAVEGDPDLMTLGAVIGCTLRAEFEHCYLFIKGKDFYEPDDWVEESIFPEHSHSLLKSHLSDLGDSFTYVYDTGEGYEFKCKVMKRPYKYNAKGKLLPPSAMVLEGAGQGLFENDRRSLERYLFGEIPPEAEDNEEEWYFLPMNYHLDNFGDFDSPINLNEFIYYYDDIRDLIQKFSGTVVPVAEDVSEDYDDEDEEDLFFSMLRAQAASDIFNDEVTNKEFRRLIQTHDINEAYEMIAEVFINNVMSASSDPDKLDEKYYKEIQKLK